MFCAHFIKKEVRVHVSAGPAVVNYKKHTNIKLLEPTKVLYGLQKTCSIVVSVILFALVV
jgi:hypothetical protein